ARPPIEVFVRFIDDSRAQFGVEPIIRALRSTSATIALSTYYAHKSRPPSARSIRDKQITQALRRIFAENYSCYGARKLWAEINREGTVGHVARCTVERLMAAEGLVGDSPAAEKAVDAQRGRRSVSGGPGRPGLRCDRAEYAVGRRHHLHSHPDRLGVRG